MVGWCDGRCDGTGNAGGDLRGLGSLEDEEHNVENVFVFDEAMEEGFRRRGIVVDCLRTADETGRWRKEDILVVVVHNGISGSNQPDRAAQVSNCKLQELCHR